MDLQLWEEAGPGIRGASISMEWTATADSQEANTSDTARAAGPTTKTTAEAGSDASVQDLARSSDTWQMAMERGSMEPVKPVLGW